MGNDAYVEYINSQKWANKRAIKLLLSKDQCEGCKAREMSYHVHHLTYARLFDELMSDLMVLCERCHKTAEDYIKRGKLTRTGNTTELRKLTREMLRSPIRTKYKPSAGAIADRERRERERLLNIKQHQKKKVKRVLTPEEIKAREIEQKYFNQERYAGGTAPRARY